MSEEYHSQLNLLTELQKIDLKLHEDRLALISIPRKIEELEAAHREARAEYDTVKAELAESEKLRRTDESELAASVAHLKEREAKLYAIKTNKEYQAAIKEITEAKRLNKEREDRILQTMEKIEELTKKIEQLDSSIAEKDSEFEKAKAGLEKERNEVEAQIAEFDSRRPELLEKIDKFLLRRYDHVRTRYPDALVAVVKNICSGCNMNIPPQLFIEVMRAKDFKNCPSCHRLIFAPVEKEGEEKAAEEVKDAAQ